MSDAEKWQINRFLELMGEAPRGTIDYPDPPDAVITSGGSCVAIEHTRIIRPASPGQNLRAYERRTDNIADKAQRRFEAGRNDALQVTLYFDDRIQLARSDEDEIAETTVAVVSAHIPPVGEDWRLEAWRFQVSNQPSPRGVEAIWIHHVPGWGALWSVARSTTVPDLTAHVVQRKIDGKESKLESYRLACDTVWLLLVVEGFAPSSHWSLERFPTDHPFDTSFDRVFLYHQFSAEIRELTLRHGRQ